MYISRKNDSVDLALGNFINKYIEDNKMEIMFLRESEGIYRYGKKRVYIKMEKPDNQLKVRVGGGFVKIDDFIK